MMTWTKSPKEINKHNIEHLRRSTHPHQATIHPKDVNRFLDVQSGAGNLAIQHLLNSGGIQLAPISAPTAVKGEGWQAPDTDVSVEVGEHEVEVSGKVLNLEGKTNAVFGGKATTKNLKVSQAKDELCKTVSGTLVETFSVSTTVSLPPIPPGLTKCQRANVKKAIDTVLAPHEQQHVTAFKTYNGTAERPFSVVECPGDDFNALLSSEFEVDRGPREAAAQKLSDDLDPPGGFSVDVDIDEGCEEPKKP